MSGFITKVTVTVMGLNHTFPDDIDMLLVGPEGQTVMLMSDCGGGSDLVDVDLTFDDGGKTLLPDEAQVVSGTYKPTNYDFADLFTGGPNPPFGATLSVLRGTSPNGVWKLYINDDAPVDGGSVAGGWSLSITTDADSPPVVSPIADVTTALGTAPDPVAFNVTDPETPSEELVVTAVSSSTDLIPNENIVINGTGADRTLVITPVPNVYGSAVITVAATDPAALSTSQSFTLTITPPEGQDVVLVAASWSLQVDGNHNGYFESARLNWDADVPGGGDRTVYEKVYRRTNDAPWELVYMAAPHTISGVGNADAQFFDVVQDPAKYPALVDYKIEIYTLDPGTPVDVRVPANDPNLRGHKEEGLPDLIVWAPSILPVLSTHVYQSTDCAATHGCTVAGIRRLVEFGLQTRNIGHSDLYLGSPINNPSFVWDVCHGHYHFQGFATYKLLSGDSIAAAGNKVGFCLEDVGRFDPAANPFPKYKCSDQGIQSGWFDNYGLGLTCQWIDITGVPPGDYTLEVTVNPFGLIAEADYANNKASVPITITNTVPRIRDIADQSTMVNTPTPAIPFTIWDAETSWNSLVLSVTSSNPGLVPVESIVFAGTGTDRSLTITPALNQVGVSTITVTVADSNGATASTSFILHVNTSHSPLITLGETSIPYVENDPATVIDAGATVSDPDSPNFDGGNLTVDIIENGADEDRIELRNQGTGAEQVGVSGDQVTWGGVVIGTMTGGTNGSSPLTISFTSPIVTPAVAQALSTNITYRNVSDNPSPLPRTTRFVIGDGTGGISPSVTKAILVIPVNDVPSLVPSSDTLNYTTASPPILLAPTVQVADLDSPDFQLGHFVIRFTENGIPSDRLWIQTDAMVSVSSGAISYAGTPFGTIAGGLDGTTPLTVNFDVIPSIVTPAVAEDLLRHLQYWNVSAQPSLLPRTVEIEVADGDGGTNTMTRVVHVLPRPVDPPVVWVNPEGITYGTALSGVQLNAEAGVPGTFTYTPPLGTVLNAGPSQPLSATFTPDDGVAYNTITVSVLIDVAKATPIVNWAPPAPITYGTTLSSAQLSANSDTPGSFTYTPAAGTLLGAGASQTLSVLFTPGDTANINPVTMGVPITVLPATPTITWAPPANIVYGTALSPAELAASAGIPGTLVYVPPAGTVLHAGAGQTLSVTFTPTDSINYLPTGASVPITVQPAPLTITADDKSRPRGALNPALTATYGGLVNGDSAASLATPVTLSTTAEAGSPEGPYPISASGATSPDYLITHVPGTLTVLSSELVSLTQSWRYTGESQDAVPGWRDASFDDSAWASGSALLYVEDNPLVTPLNTDLGTVRPTYYFRTHFTFGGTLAPGSRLVFSNLVDDGAVFHLNGQEIRRLRMPAAPEIVLYDTLASGAPDGGDATSPDVFFIEGSPLAALVPGDNVLAVEVHQESVDSPDVVFGASVTLVVPAVPTITWANPADITYGMALSPTQLNAGASVPGTFSYSPDVGTVPDAGPGQVLSVVFTPDDGIYNTPATATVTLNVNKATPAIDWPSPADIPYGTPLSASQLNAQVGVAGTLVYDPPVGTVLGAGSSQPLSVLFVPAQANNYVTASAATSLNVLPAPLTITADNKFKISGQSNPALTVAYSGFVNGDGPGSLTSPPTASTTADAGSAPGNYPITAAGAAGDNYAITYVPGVLTVLPATVVSVDVNPSNVTVPIHGTQQFTAIAHFSNGTSQDVTATAQWASGNSVVASVDAAGLATGLKGGATLITASYGGGSGAASFTIEAGPVTVTYDNTTPLTIPSSGPSTPYPSTIDVSGLGGNLLKVVVQLKGLTHTYAADIDMMLVGPRGQAVVILSDVGGSQSISGMDLTLDDDAALSLPPDVNLAPGTWKPTNYLTPDYFAPPAPDPDYNLTLSTFQDTDPNGTWSLYVMDDAGGDSGSLDGWSLVLTYATGTASEPPAQLIALDQSWRYSGANQDATPEWKDPAFDDSGWTAGSALLAVEDNPLVGPKGTDLGTVQPAYYFRTHFNLDALPSPGSILVFSNFLDDGAVFYLNGHEVRRIRMPDAPEAVTYATLATGSPAGGDATSAEVFIAGTEATAHLQVGDNVIAVEVHQESVDSPDVVFGASVTRATPQPSELAWFKPADIVYGTPLSATQLDATANVPGTFVYNPPAGSLLNAGAAQTLSVTFTPDDFLHYKPSSATVKLNVLKAVPTITWSDPPDLVYGAALGSGQLNAVADAPGTFGYLPAAGTVLDAGPAQALTVTFTPDDAVNLEVATAAVQVNVLPSTPVITWANPADIVYGTGLGPAQLNAIADVPGTFAYTPPSGTVLGAGPGQTLSVLFTPDDTANHTPATATVGLNVLPSTPVITWAPPADITYGTPLDLAQLNATADVPGTFAYTPAAGAILGAGPGQTLSVLFTPDDTANHTPATATVGLNVLKAAPHLVWAAPADITYGTPLSAAQLNATADVPGTFDYSPGPGTLLHGGNGQALTVAFTPADAANYTPAAAGVPINVLRAAPVVSWGAPADIVYGTPLSDAQLNATADVPGVFEYSPPGGTVLGAGPAHPLSVLFTPANTTDYAPASAGVTLTVLKASPVLTWANPPDISYGTPLSETELNATASVAGTFVYTPAAGTVLTAGPGKTLSVAFTPADAANYNTAGASVLLTVLKAHPVIKWPDLAAIVYGTALGDDQLSATANVPGTFAFSPASGTVLHAGADQPLAALFTPTDGANYEAATAAAKLTVNPAPLQVTAEDKSRPKGASNPVLTASYSGFVNGDGPASLSTAPTLSTTATPASPAGNYPITVSGAASDDYAFTYVPGTLKVTDAEVVSVMVVPGVYTVDQQETLQLAARASLTDGSLQDVTTVATWGSDTESVGTVDAAGLAKGLTAGMTTLRATYLGFSGSMLLTVTTDAMGSTPSRILTVAALSTGQYHITFEGSAHHIYAVEATDDLVTWVQLGTLTLESTTGEFTDPTVPVPGTRFYRVRLLGTAPP